ncbi:phage holin family protein [Allokutzneria oryzae]|uniref:Phage holin family protein n=1 Tax=Allokutzneria oryzae TaxID=1378989 RepID=A0ABV5ZZC2_9PSEU
MTVVTSAQHNGNGSGAELPPVASIPLTDDSASTAAEQSIGGLVREATTHVSTLIRAELELAKIELKDEVRKGLKGSVYFILALAILVFSLFFLFFFLGELLSVWLYRWAAFGIVFLLMLAGAGLFGLMGYRKVSKIRAPERTIRTMRENASIARRSHDEEPEVPAKY